MADYVTQIRLRQLAHGDCVRSSQRLNRIWASLVNNAPRPHTDVARTKIGLLGWENKAPKPKTMGVAVGAGVPGDAIPRYLLLEACHLSLRDTP